MPPKNSYRVTARCCRSSVRQCSAVRKGLRIAHDVRTRLLRGCMNRVSKSQLLRAAMSKDDSRREIFRRLTSKPCTGQCPRTEFA
jgi:hypothetical protein